MKQSILLLAALLYLYTPGARAQSVVYYCPVMGAIGYTYSNDEDGHDIKALEKQALAMCVQHGGTQCALIYESKKIGWGGIIKGRDINNAPLVLTVGHQQSEAFAQGELERNYLFRDGIQFDDVLVITWRAE